MLKKNLDAVCDPARWRELAKRRGYLHAERESTAIDVAKRKEAGTLSPETP